MHPETKICARVKVELSIGTKSVRGCVFNLGGLGIVAADIRPVKDNTASARTIDDRVDGERGIG